MIASRLAFAALALAAATTLAAADKPPKVRIALPEDFVATAEPMPVQKKFFGGSKPMKFGSFEVRDFSRGWKRTRSSSSPILPPYISDPVGGEAHREKSSMRFSYALYEGGEAKLVCNCEQRENSSSTTVRGIPVQSSGTMDLECTFLPIDDSPEWTLDVDAYGSLSQLRQTAAGTLSRLDERLQIDGVDHVTGSTFRVPAPLGYTFSGEGSTAGAVDLTGRGTVLLAPSIDSGQRHAIAAAATALMAIE